MKTRVLAAALTGILLFVGMPLRTLAGAQRDMNSDILSIQVPDNLDFKIDPYELEGRGQIYSDHFSFVNNGETDLHLSLLDIQIVLPNQEDYLLVETPIGLKYESEKKAIYLALNFDSGFDSPVVMTAGHVQDISLMVPANGGSVSFSVSGSVNDDLENRWYDNEVKISMIYRFEPAQISESLPQENTEQNGEEQSKEEEKRDVSGNKLPKEEDQSPDPNTENGSAGQEASEEEGKDEGTGSRQDMEPEIPEESDADREVNDAGSNGQDLSEGQSVSQNTNAYSGN